MWNRRTLGQIASWIAIATGAFHAFGHYGLMNAHTEEPTGKQLLQLLRTWKDPDLNRTLFELLAGFSLAFSIFPIAFGAVTLMAVRQGDARLRACVLRVAAVCFAAMSAVGLTYWFAVPNTFLVAAFAFYTASLLAREPR